MPNFQVRNISHKTNNCLVEMAKKRRLSKNTLILDILDQASGKQSEALIYGYIKLDYVSNAKCKCNRQPLELYIPISANSFGRPICEKCIGGEK